MQYKTKPCVIDAIQWIGDKIEIKEFIDNDSYLFIDDDLYIDTLEGNMKANIGDYIIRGVKNEYYPCKPEAFTEKYTTIDDNTFIVREKLLSELKKIGDSYLKRKQFFYYEIYTEIVQKIHNCV